MDETRQQDLDMLYVLRRIKRSVNNFFAGILWIISFSFANFFKLSLFVIAAIALFIGLYSIKDAYYTSSLTIDHIRVDNDYCRELITNLDGYIDGETNGLLAEKLQISSGKAMAVRSVSYVDLNEHIAQRFADSAHILLPFKVEVEITDKNVLDSLQIGILNYLESNEYGSRRKKLDLATIDLTKHFLKNQISEIDSLKGIVSRALIPRGTGNGIIYGEPLDPVHVYRRAMDLFERKLQLDVREELINSFEVIVAFNKTTKRSGAGVLVYALIGLIIGYSIGLFWLLPRQNPRKTQ